MDRTTAISIVEEYRARWGYPGTLEAMEAMQAEIEADTLERREAVAYRIVFAGMRELFFGPEAMAA